MGSVVGGLGSAIGDVTGGLLGGVTSGIAGQLGPAPQVNLFSDLTEQDRLGLIGEAALVGDRLAPTAQAAQLATGPADQVRAQQQTLANQLQAQATGQAPSLAEAQLRQATDRSLAQQLALAASQRGGNQAATQRQLLRNQAQAGQNIARDAATARIQEQQLAQQTLGGQLSGIRQADIGQATTQAQLQQQTNLANQQAELQNQAQKDAQQRFLKQEQLRLRQEQQNIVNQEQLQNAQLQQQQQQKAEQAAGATIGGLGSAISTGISLFSDEDLKKDIKDANKDVKKFLDALQAKSFTFKDKEKANNKENKKSVGITAQDLEKSEMGKTMVEDTKEGKQVNMKEAFSAVLASQAFLNQRLNDIEKTFSSRKKKKA